MTKTAVVLFNLGGPDRLESIEPFLRNFFSDKNIIGLPAPMRLPLAWIAARKRARGAAQRSYSELGGGSPILQNTELQATALETALGKGFKTFVCMRYWHPMASDTVRAVKQYAPDHVVLLPLYPQFSTTTSRSSLEDWNRAARQAGLKAPQSFVCCYPAEENFVVSSAHRIRQKRDEALRGVSKVRVLFSAHGLPEKIINGGDPYQWQCEQGAKAIAAAAGLTENEWRICYQSRVGPLKWIGPSLDDELKQAAADNAAVVIYPHAFVSEHVETLVELDIEYKRRAQEYGVPGYYRVETLGADSSFINGLARIVKQSTQRSGSCSAEGQRICPCSLTQCGMAGNALAEAA
ncbi:MAG TPA: ferrochelatase [Alphaproteobacteria bacterium]|jgi:ferrochelatase